MHFDYEGLKELDDTHQLIDWSRIEHLLGASFQSSKGQCKITK